MLLFSSGQPPSFQILLWLLPGGGYIGFSLLQIINLLPDSQNLHAIGGNSESKSSTPVLRWSCDFEKCIRHSVYDPKLLYEDSSLKIVYYSLPCYVEGMK